MLLFVRFDAAALLKCNQFARSCDPLALVRESACTVNDESAYSVRRLVGLVAFGRDKPPLTLKL